NGTFPDDTEVRETTPQESPYLRLAAERPSAAPSVVINPTPSAPTVEEEGGLQQQDLAQLFARLHAAGFSGRLRFTRDDGEKSVYLDAGLPVFATSSYA